MPMSNTKELLLAAQKGHYAVGAFNVENMEMAQAVVAAAEILSAPVILQTTPSTVRYASLDLYLAMARALAEKTSVPVAMHLDHGNSFDLAATAYRVGYTSIMIDGSTLPFKENVSLTCRVVKMCASGNVPVEAELGTVGGKEDNLEASITYTDPVEARHFVEQTGASSLAVAIGTTHGPYHGRIPKLDVDRLRSIHKMVNVPLVLHGASGLDDDQLRKCVAEGICKVNFATEVRMAYTKGVRQLLSKKSQAYDPKEYGLAGRENVMKFVIDRIKVCGWKL